MAEFHNTVYGQRFFNHQLPEITKQLSRIADAMEDLKPVKYIGGIHAKVPDLVGKHDYVPHPDLDEELKLMHESAHDKKIREAILRITGYIDKDEK